MNKSSYVSKGRIITENIGREERPRKSVVRTRVISTRRMMILSQGTGVEKRNNVTPTFLLKEQETYNLVGRVTGPHAKQLRAHYTRNCRGNDFSDSHSVQSGNVTHTASC